MPAANCNFSWSYATPLERTRKYCKPVSTATALMTTMTHEQASTTSPIPSAAPAALAAANAAEPQPGCCEVCLIAPCEGFALVPCTTHVSVAYMDYGDARLCLISIAKPDMM